MAGVKKINKEKLRLVLQKTLFDECDRPLAEDENWIISQRGYLVSLRRYKKGMPYVFHRIVTGAPDGVFVDHKNGNKLDNRRSNLRFATRAQNHANQKKSKASRSCFKGIHFRKERNVWQVSIRENGKQRNVTCSKYEKVAALLYDAVARKTHGEFATLNYPLSYERSAR